MQTNYDPDSNIASIEITSGDIAYAKELNGIILHMGSAGIPVYIEILDAGSMITKLGKLKETSSIKPAGETAN